MKKVFSLVLFVILAVAVSVTAFAADSDIIASGYCGGEGDGTNLEWVLTADGTLTISGEGKMMGYYISSNNRTAAPWGEHSGKVYKIIIEEGVTTIGNYTFYFCSVSSGDIVIPSSVVNIGEGSFEYCGVDNYIFEGCPNVVDPDGNHGSFDRFDKLYYNWEKNTWSLKNGKWQGYSNIYIYDSVEGKTTLKGKGYCGAEGDGKNLVWALDNNDELIISGEGAMADYEIFPKNGEIAPWRNMSSEIGELIIEEGVTTIGNAAFYDCSGFGSLVIPNSMTRIGGYSFYNCSGFRSLTIGNSVESIETYAFRECSGFTGDLVIPDSVTTIGYYAFNGCSGFTGNLTIGNGVTTIESGAFNGCSGFTGDLVIPDSVTTIGESAFKKCSGFDGNLIIGNNVTAINNYVFKNCSGFIGITIGNSVKAIGEEAFYGCFGFIGDLVIPDSVKKIYESAFENCFGFTGNLIIGNGVTTIENSAFSGCSGFTGNLIIPNSVISIESSAFDGCSGFSESLTIGNSIETIGSFAFRGCSGFTGNLIFPESITTIYMKAFDKCGIYDYYFTGDAPKLDNNDILPVFDSNDIVYYPIGNLTWIIEDGRWNGYKAWGWGEHECRFGEWYETKKPTWDETGEKYRRCELCGDIETEIIPKIEYIYGDVDVDREITVKDVYLTRLLVAKLIPFSGKQEYSSDVNGDGKTTIIDANIIRKFAVNIITVFPCEDGHEHDYTKDLITDAPTCTEFGTKNVYCACGEFIIAEASPMGHKYNGMITTEATCVKEGVKTFTCSVCGDSYTEAVPTNENHNYISEVTKAETCADSGIKTYTCSDCQKSYTEEIPATGKHGYNSKIKIDATCTETGIKTYTCSVCGDSYDETIPMKEHDWNSATCTKPKTCKACGITSGSSAGHSYSGKVTTAATCASNGVMTYTCSVCKDSYTKEISATGKHSYSSKVTTEATCTETGIKTYTCSVCKDSYTESIPANGHSWNDATCTEAKKCRTCGTTSGSALGHNYVGGNCTTAGKCSRCGVKQPNPGHSYSGGICTACGKFDPDAWLTKEELLEIADVLDTGISYSIDAMNDSERAVEYYDRGYYSSARTAGQYAQESASAAQNSIAVAYNMLGDFNVYYNFDGVKYSLQDLLINAFSFYQNALDYDLSVAANVCGVQMNTGSAAIWHERAQKVIIALLENGYYV
ncbi:MAG: leucine-rich repeat protein [Oscillospiraceae bacterium]|nr:leucine-rich repeat protein [Oscillospiraceae bacterium]